MTTILIINAASLGVAVFTSAGVILRRRLRPRRVQRVYVTVDGRHITRDEAA